MYWMRVSWPSSFSATLAYVGQKFCGDTVFRSSYPDLMQPALLTGYQSGKTSWDEQHFMSSECIIKDLKSRRYIVDKGQIFDWTALESAATHKSAAIIYSAFGASYADRAARAEGLYQDEMNARLIPLDKNADGKLSGEETVQKEQWMTR
jgi:hypothetical protein